MIYDMGKIRSLLRMCSDAFGSIGKLDEVTGERNALVEKVNELTGERNALVGKVNELTGERNALVGKVNQLTGERNALVGNVNELTGERNTLVSKVNRLAAGRNQPVRSDSHERVRESRNGQAIQGQQADQIENTKKCLFLIVANNRSGSTWLETALGALPDVYADYEIKLGARDYSNPAHVLIGTEYDTVSDFLKSQASVAEIVGSKLVFDTGPSPLQEVDALREAIGSGVKIIHLVRSISEVFLSRRRGFYHAYNERTEHASDSIILNMIKSSPVAGSIPDPDKTEVDLIECFKEVASIVQNDLLVSQLREIYGNDYILIDYESITSCFGEIVSFIRSSAAESEISRIVSEPPIAKLPAIEPHDLVTNYDELKPVFQEMESMRNGLVRDSSLILPARKMGAGAAAPFQAE